MGNTTREQRKTDFLYPMLILAALVVIAFGVMGVVTMSSVLPRSEPISAAHAPQRSVPPPSPAADREPTAPSGPDERATAKSGASPAPENRPSRVTVPANTTL